VLRLRLAFIPFSIFLLALLVRVLGFGWGLPNAGRWGSYHPDESVGQIVGAVVSVLQNGGNPRFFNYPSLPIYATTVIYSLMSAFGLTVQGPPQPYPWPLVRDIIIAGRMFSALCGAGCAVCVWGMARQVGLRRGAILSGVLLALCPGLVQHSHFATVDVPATFFVSACLWATLAAYNAERSGGKLWLIVALLAGLATGAKYNAAIVIVAPLVALYFAHKEGREKFIARRFFLVIGLAALAFFVSTPYALLSPREFWGDSSRQTGLGYELLVHPRQGHGEIFQGTGLGWVYHLTFNLPFVLTWPLLLAGLIGAVFARKERRHLPLIAFALVYFLIIGASNVRFMRYTFLLVPPLLVWASLAASRLRKPQVWACALGVFALWGTKDVLVPLVSVDPRDQAASYMKRIGGTLTLVDKPWFWTPPFQPSNLNTSVPGVKVVGFDFSKIDPRTDTLAVCDYEWREQLRLRPNGIEAKFGENIIKDATLFQSPRFASLPGRAFEPHDYLYTHPRVWVHRLR